MKDTDYAFCVARIRALENKMLIAQDINTLIDKKSYNDGLSFLEEKGYLCNQADVESIVQVESDKLQLLLEESVPDKSELNSLYLINDFFNIKALVKAEVTSTDVTDSLVYPTTITFEKSSDEPFSNLDDKYRSVALKAYDIALKTRNGKFSDGIIDRAAIDTLADASKNKKSRLTGKICAFLADTANIKVALRCVQTNQDTDYVREAIGKCCAFSRDKLIEKTLAGKDELLEFLLGTEYKNGVEIYNSKPSDFDKWCDDELINKTRSAIYTCFGFDPVVSYYYRKNLEIKTVRMILTALKSNTDKNIIHERVRKFYA